MSTHDNLPAEDAPLDGHEEFEALAVGQALHALEPGDEQRLAAHLINCPRCARTVLDAAALGAVLAGTIDPVEPPAGLRARLLAAAEAEPRPVAEGPVAQGPSATRDGGGVTDAGLPRPLLSPPARTIHTWQSEPARQHAASGEDVPAQSKRLRPAVKQGETRALWRRPRVLALTAVLAGILGAGVAVPATLSLTRSSGDSTQTALAQAMAAPGSRTVALTGGGGATGRAVVSDKGLFLVVDGLPHNDERTSTYVLWGTGTGGDRKALATFDVTGRSPVMIAQPTLGNLAAGTGFAVSYEKGRVAPAQPSDVMLTGSA